MKLKFLFIALLKIKIQYLLTNNQQIGSKYFQLNHFSNVDVNAYREHHPECRAY